MEENRRQLAAMNLKQIVEIRPDEDAYFESLAPGFRFRPTKKELLYYLKARVCNGPLPALPPNYLLLIRDVNLYHYHPQDLTRTYDKLVLENKGYFFTARNRCDRTTADGYWWPTGSEDKSITFDDQIKGFRTSLVYYVGKHPTGKKTYWKMHEYRLHELHEEVLCKVYRNAESKKNENDEYMLPESKL